jgi:hypothetical protein
MMGGRAYPQDLSKIDAILTSMLELSTYLHVSPDRRQEAVRT